MNRILATLVAVLALGAPATALEPIPDKLVVLTFDDSSKSHHSVARPILLKYKFGATFFVTEGFDFPTNKKDYMTWEEIVALHKDGFEIGNHTLDHLPMHGLSADQVRRQIAADAAMITRAVPGIEVSTLALPLGSRPRNHRLMMSGTWHGTSYRNAAAWSGPP